jgi:hypothetical protein
VRTWTVVRVTWFVADMIASGVDARQPQFGPHKSKRTRKSQHRAYLTKKKKNGCNFGERRWTAPRQSLIVTLSEDDNLVICNIIIIEN